MAARGRPKAPVKEPPMEKEEVVAEMLARMCGIPGCGARYHIEDARTIIRVIKGEN